MGRRLESWKEIADALNVTVRTAQLWEKVYQLPVRRIRLNRRYRVFAFSGELEAWQASRRHSPRRPGMAGHVRKMGAMARKLWPLGRKKPDDHLE